MTWRILDFLSFISAVVGLVVAMAAGAVFFFTQEYPWIGQWLLQYGPNGTASALLAATAFLLVHKLLPPGQEDIHWLYGNAGVALAVWMAAVPFQFLWTEVFVLFWLTALCAAIVSLGAAEVMRRKSKPV